MEVCIGSGVRCARHWFDFLCRLDHIQDGRPADTFSFQAEVNRLMDILIHSVYSNKDIFLRELISNASDALNRMRILAITSPGQVHVETLHIQLETDRAERVLKIRDNGVGMTKQELIQNLGTIARSGTSSVLDRLEQVDSFQSLHVPCSLLLPPPCSQGPLVCRRVVRQ